MAEIKLYVGEYGNIIRARTLCSDINEASNVKITFKRESDGTKAELAASVVPNDTTYYAVDAIVTQNWTASKQGSWIGQVKATFASGVYYGGPFWMTIEDPPSE